MMEIYTYSMPYEYEEESDAQRARKHTHTHIYMSLQAPYVKARAALRVDAARRWPTTVSEYTAMMDPAAPNPVLFTRKGDREVVAFIFYRVCFGMLHAHQ